MLRANLTYVWSMLGWCIVILVGARLKAFVRFPPLRGMYQRGTYKGCDIVKYFGRSHGFKSKKGNLIVHTYYNYVLILTNEFK